MAGRTTYYRFVRANDWGASIFANFWEGFREFEPIPDAEPKAGSFFLEGFLSLGGGWLMEKMGRLVLGTHLRRQRMRAGNPNSVRLTSNAVKLHFKDHGEELARQIETMLARKLPESDAAADAAGPVREGISAGTWQLLCPECGASAFTAGADLHCPTEGRRFEDENGILPLLGENRRRELAYFLETYRKLRRAEGWGGAEEYYRDLPFKDHSGRHRSIWRLRARSYTLAMQATESHFPELKKTDECDKRALRILELGAGNGWLSRRMAERGHFVLATDISLDEEDGLGALDRYGSNGHPWRARVTRARADMEALALEGAQFDLVVANGSIHYAEKLSRPVQRSLPPAAPWGPLSYPGQPYLRRRSGGSSDGENTGARVQETLRPRPRPGPSGFSRLRGVLGSARAHWLPSTMANTLRRGGAHAPKDLLLDDEPPYSGQVPGLHRREEVMAALVSICLLVLLLPFEPMSPLFEALGFELSFLEFSAAILFAVTASLLLLPRNGRLKTFDIPLMGLMGYAIAFLVVCLLSTYWAEPPRGLPFKATLRVAAGVTAFVLTAWALVRSSRSSRMSAASFLLASFAAAGLFTALVGLLEVVSLPSIEALLAPFREHNFEVGGTARMAATFP